MISSDAPFREKNWSFSGFFSGILREIEASMGELRFNISDLVQKKVGFREKMGKKMGCQRSFFDLKHMPAMRPEGLEAP
jgi:hypothetical protein